MRGKLKKRRPSAYIAMLLCLCAALLAAGLVQNRRVQALTLQVNAAYQKALYETTTLMSGVQLNLEKLLVSASNTQEQALLTTIAQQAEGVQSNLTSMPFDQELLEGTMKFVNQTSDYARVLSEQLGAGGKLGEDDIRQLISLHDASVQLNTQLGEILNRYERGELVFETNRQSIDAARSQDEESQPMVDYPVLLYDGPFSDARPGEEVTVPGEQVDAERAKQLLSQYLGEERINSITLSASSELLGPTYEFDVDSSDGRLDAAVTVNGGHVLYVLPEQSVSQVMLTQGECIQRAAQFLASRGYGPMEVSYWRQLGGILTVNFAAVQDGVILYPDLIKLQISMQTGQVIGVEAGNYLTNHRTRALVEPAFTRQQALDSLGAVLTAQRIRQCVIPLESGEAQCWEITATVDGSNQYLVYKDVNTGQEQMILRVMTGDDGVLTQ